MAFMLKCSRCKETLSPEDPVVRRAQRCPYCVAVLDIPMEEIFQAGESLRKKEAAFCVKIEAAATESWAPV